MSIVIINRWASSQDLIRVIEINQFWVNKLQNLDIQSGFLRSSFSRADFETFVASQRLVLATIEDRVVGYSVLNDGILQNEVLIKANILLSGLELPSKYAYLAHIAVDINFLNQGINKGMLAFLRKHFMNQYDYFYGFVFSDNTHALSAHLHSGWKVIAKNGSGDSLIAVPTTGDLF